MQGVELTPEVPVERIVELGAAAEIEGFDVAFVSCHYNNRDPFVAVDRLAVATETMAVGPGVANPYESHPVSLASRLGTLAEASGGRVVCGLGAGDRSTLRHLGVDRSKPLLRVRETIEVSRQLWAGEQVTHDGTFVARDAKLNYEVDGEIPIYVGAQGPGMLRMSAAIADGVLVNASHELDVAWATDHLAAGLEERRGDLGPFQMAAYASVSVAADEGAAREAARPPVAFIVGGADSQVLDRHGIDHERAKRIGSLVEGGRFSDAFSAVTGPMLDAFCIAGSPDQVADRFDGLLAHVDGIVAGSPLGPDPRQSIELLAQAFERSSLG